MLIVSFIIYQIVLWPSIINYRLPEWQQAMNEEIESLKTNNTLDLMHRPDDRKVLDSKWVYRIKDEENY